ncbi:hypothetical protein ABEB36_005644 [Hypothenemus hampei]|uniref:Uncharacterized protein n=1 Tax=Hypothenemus hampei TaxID=57062 RepID=A0ABD1EZC1_HYPHA
MRRLSHPVIDLSCRNQDHVSGYIDVTVPHGSAVLTNQPVAVTSPPLNIIRCHIGMSRWHRKVASRARFWDQNLPLPLRSTCRDGGGMLFEGQRLLGTNSV